MDNVHNLADARRIKELEATIIRAVKDIRELVSYTHNVLELFSDLESIIEEDKATKENLMLFMEAAVEVIKRIPSPTPKGKDEPGLLPPEGPRPLVS
jgi:hypothetical protein